ncbi:hypothetical protein BH18ACT15_BH18ACT15_03820 [soil metagenome]
MVHCHLEELSCLSPIVVKASLKGVVVAPFGHQSLLKSAIGQPKHRESSQSLAPGLHESTEAFVGLLGFPEGEGEAPSAKRVVDLEFLGGEPLSAPVAEAATRLQPADLVFGDLETAPGARRTATDRAEALTSPTRTVEDPYPDLGRWAVGRQGLEPCPPD